MIIRSAQLETVCGVTSILPHNLLPEVAFAGKSNVGKSSLINALLGRRKLARTSSSPGKTQTINFYNINQEFYLVDLPGYGYAKASMSEKAQWGNMIERYLHTSRQLKTVFLLVDIRHEPGDNDLLMFDWIRENALDTVIVATKADKISRMRTDRQIRMIREKLGAGETVPVIPFSAVTRQGQEELMALVGERTGVEVSETASLSADPATDTNGGSNPAREDENPGRPEPVEETENVIREESGSEVRSGAAWEMTDALREATRTNDPNPGPAADRTVRKERWPRGERHKAARKNRKKKSR